MHANFLVIFIQFALKSHRLNRDTKEQWNTKRMEIMKGKTGATYDNVQLKI